MEAATSSRESPTAALRRTASAAVHAAIARETLAREASEQQLGDVLAEDAALDDELARTSAEIARLGSGGADGEDHALARIVSDGDEFGPEQLAWSLEAHGGAAAAADSGRLQLTTSQAHAFGSVWENQRRGVGVFRSREFNVANLTKADRGPWTDSDGADRPRAPLPPGMSWVVNTDSAGTSPEGWQYSFGFGQVDDWHDHDRGRLSMVRRREWIAVAMAAADAAVPAEWASRFGPNVYLPDSPFEADVMVVEVRQGRHAAGAAGTQLCARVSFDDRSFTTGPQDSGGDPIWHDATNSLNCRQCFAVSEELRSVARGHVPEPEPGLAERALCAVRVRTEEWVQLKIDVITFMFSDGSTAQHGSPSDVGTSQQGVIEEHTLVLELPHEHLICVKTLTTENQMRRGSNGSLSGLVFVTNFGRRWTVGRKQAQGTERYLEHRFGVAAHGQCILGLRVTQSWEGWLSRVDGIDCGWVQTPGDVAALAAAQAPTEGAEPSAADESSKWSVHAPSAWCATQTYDTLPRDALSVEIVAPGQQKAFGGRAEKVLGRVRIPLHQIFRSVGCDGWYIIAPAEGDDSPLAHAFSGEQQGDYLSTGEGDRAGRASCVWRGAFWPWRCRPRSSRPCRKRLCRRPPSCSSSTTAASWR